MKTIRLLGVVFFGLVLPQALGLMGFRWARQKGMIVKLATLLISPAIFFSSAYLFWGLSALAMRDSGNYVCGAFGAAAVFSTLSGTLINLVLGVIIFLVADYIWNKQAAKPQDS